MQLRGCEGGDVDGCHGGGGVVWRGRVRGDQGAEGKVRMPLVKLERRFKMDKWSV